MTADLLWPVSNGWIRRTPDSTKTSLNLKDYYKSNETSIAPFQYRDQTCFFHELTFARSLGRC